MQENLSYMGIYMLPAWLNSHLDSFRAFVVMIIAPFGGTALSIQSPRTTLYSVSSTILYLLNKTNLNNPITRNPQIRHLRPRILSHPQKCLQQRRPHKVRPRLHLHLLLANDI